MIGRFQVVSKLGEGGMGIVLLATDPMLGRRVALKLLRTGSDSSAERRARFLREAQVMARLTHENVVIVYEVGTHDGHDFVAMEYVEGGTLNGWAAGKSWREIAAMYLRAGRGLEAAHKAGLVHRDFKPDNVLVGTDGRVRVSDFGLAGFDAAEIAATISASGGSSHTVPAELTRTGSLMGTPRYMAPEQHLGHALDARADQFSFCVALYEALFGTPPYPGTTYAELAHYVLSGKPVPPPADTEVPAVLADALMRGLSRDAEDRFPSMSEVLAVLEARPAPSRVPSSWLVPAIGLGVAAAAITAVVVLRRGADSTAPAPIDAGSGSGSGSPAPAPADIDNGQPRIIIGTYDGAAMTDTIAAKSRTDVAKLLEKRAPDVLARLTPGPLDEQLGARGRVFQLDVRLDKLDVASPGKVTCKVTETLSTYPAREMIGFLNGGATVETGTSLKDIDVGGADCVDAVLEDLLLKKVVPTIRNRSAGSGSGG